jgi:hypothetical protein
MTGWFLVVALATGLGGAGWTLHSTEVDYCPMVLETATRVLGPFTDDATTLEKGCVQEAASAGGVTYAEAIGFEPMPLKTVTCEGNGWVVQIGQSPPKAPTGTSSSSGSGESVTGPESFGHSCCIRIGGTIPRRGAFGLLVDLAAAP